MEKELKITTKEGLEFGWVKSVEQNDDPYGRAVIKVIAKVCECLDKGLTPKEAEDEGIKDSGITGYQAGVMASMISHFHPRGEEFKKYFNKQCGGTGEEKGTINPAILTVKTK